MADVAAEREHRFLLTSVEARRFVAVASEHLAHEVYNQLRPVSYTRTTYFDDKARSCWEDEKQGLSRRMRVRQYANAASLDSLAKLSGPAFLELKESSGELRHKQRWSTSPSLMRAVLAGKDAQAQLDELANLPALHGIALAIRAKTLLPVFSTWYRRVSLVSQRIRLTIDENVSFCPPFAIDDEGAWASPNESFDLVSGRIVELKILGSAPAWLDEAMQTLSGTETPSKFRRGMQRAGSPSRSRLQGTRPLAILAPLRPRSNS